MNTITNNGLNWRLLTLLLLGFLNATLAVQAQAPRKRSTRPIDDALRQAVQSGLPGVVATAADADGVVYQGAFGMQNAGKHVRMSVDSIFRIASMTKLVTSVAVMQLVERGRVQLDEPVGTYLPELSKVQVLEGFDAAGTPKLRSPNNPMTVRHLLTHTSGFGYELFNPTLSRYVAAGGMPSARSGGDSTLRAPILFDPGTRWEYGVSSDWLGRLVERVSGQRLDAYFQQNVFEPLDMADSFFDVPEAEQARVVTLHQRLSDGSLVEQPTPPMKPSDFLSGGGGLYSTASDYLKLTRALLGGGQLGKARILRSETVAMMGKNQIGELNIVALPSLAPQLVKDRVPLPGALKKFGLGVAISEKNVESGRAVGSLAWAGVYNTFFWIDPSRQVTGVIMMQVLPCLDDTPRAAFENFERAVYGSLSN